MRIKRISSKLGIVTVAALILSACSNGGAGGEDLPDEDKVITANNTEPENPLLPTNTNDISGSTVVNLIFSGLRSYDANGEPVDELAKSIETSDSQNYTITINPDQKFSNGEPVTAHSFVDAWNFGAAAKNTQLNSYFFKSIKGYEAVNKKDSKVDGMNGLKVIDDNTFTVELNQPESDFPLRLGYAAFYPLPEQAFEDPKAFGQDPVGNGPYKLADNGWKHDVSIELVPNEEYDGPRTAKNGGIDFTLYTEPKAAYQDLLSDNLDVLDQIPPNALQSYESDLPERNVNKPFAGIQKLVIPNYLEQFSGEAGHLRRQAISLSIDRNEVIDKIFAGTKEPAKDFSSPVISGYNDKISGHENLEFDPQKAAKLWKEADEIDRWDSSKPFLIGYNVDGAGNKEYVEAIANQIKNTLDISVQGKPYPTYKELRADVLDKRLQGASRVLWQADYPSLYNFIGPTFATGGGSNDGFYSNQAFDKKLKSGLSATSVEGGNQIFNEAQEILLEDLPVIPLWYNAVQGGWSESVTNVDFGWDGVPLYYNVTAN